MTLALRSDSAAATHALGRELAGHLRPGTVVLLHGELGSGKTTLAQGILAGLGVRETVASPTFTLANEYELPSGAGDALRVAHLDLYRLNEDSELDSIGLDDYLHPVNAITLIEWPERAATRLGPGMLLLQLTADGAGTRQLVLTGLEDATRYPWLARFVTDSATQIPGIAAVPSGDTPGTA